VCVVADEASYVRQVSLHAAAVLRVATALVGHDDAEDAAQETLTRAWRAWGTLRDTNAARSWLLRITSTSAANGCAARWERRGA
jgi:DNA-directed RNA polymerase specialized sigma24 family protein